MTENPSPVRITLAVACAGLAVLMGILFVRMERVEPRVDSWLREQLVPWLARSNIVKHLEIKSLDVKGVVLVLDFFLGTYAVIFVLLAARLIEGAHGPRPSVRVQHIATLLV